MRTTATIQSSPVAPQSGCTSAQQPGILADFGHRRSVAAANRVIAHAEQFGFKDLVVQRRGCNDYAVVLPGLTTLRQGASLQREARNVGIKVTLDCRSQPFRGEIVAVFGKARTRGAALRIAARAAGAGFQMLQVVQVGCNEWHVVLYGIETPAQRRGLAKEARSVGFHLTFEPG